MKRASLCLLLALALASSLLVIPVSADTIDLSYYNEEIYAGGILDMRVFVGEADTSGYTFQWQVDTGMGEGRWMDLEENQYYKGVKTEHLQLYTYTDRDYAGWEEIPFRCLVTKGGKSASTPALHMYIRPYNGLEKALNNWGFGLYEPHVENASALTTTDDITYTATAYAGAQLDISCGGSVATQKDILTSSEVELRREIRITENGKFITSTGHTTYFPYTIGNNAVKIEINMRIIMAGVDMGVYDTKTIRLTTKKPEGMVRGVTTKECSMLRNPYNESQILGTLPQSAVVQVAGKVGSYYQVYARSVMCFVPEELVRVDAAANESVIRNVDLTINQPTAGQTPATSCTLITTGCKLYHIEPISWINEETGKFMKAGEKFQEGKFYKVSIWVAADTGYQFQTDISGNPNLTGAINGNLPPFINKAYGEDPTQVVELTYTFKAKPAAEEAPPATEPAQPTEPAQQSHTHTPSAWRTTGIYHYKVCTVCGDMLESEDHKGGVATCSAKGSCTVCGYAYLEENENHSPDTSKWIAKGSMYHFHACKLCGAHCDTEDHRWSPTYLYQDATGHAWICADCKATSQVEPHDPGPAATETTPQTCKDCNYIIAPAKNHTHKLTKVAQTPATCTEEGNIEHYTCDGCSERFTDPEAKNKIPNALYLQVGALGHTTSENWSSDGQYHWRTCDRCGVVLDETKMLHDSGEVCATCGHKADASAPTAEPTQTAPNATESTKPTKSNRNKTGSQRLETAETDWGCMILVGAVTFAAALTATVIILKKRKK